MSRSNNNNNNNNNLLYAGYLYLYSRDKLFPWRIQCCSYSVVTIHGAYIISFSAESIVLLHKYFPKCVLLLLLLTAIGLSPGGSGYFSCIQNMKLVTTRFKLGGLHEKHVVATWNVGSHLSICL